MVSGAQMQTWLSEPLGDLDAVPGIGAKNKGLLMQPGAGGPYICNTLQLMGVFLRLKGPGLTCEAHCQEFFKWLRLHHIHYHTHTIVSAIAQKANVLFPGIYDSSKFAERPSSQVA
jgi:hypothetical protein